MVTEVRLELPRRRGHCRHHGQGGNPFGTHPHFHKPFPLFAPYNNDNPLQGTPQSDPRCQPRLALLYCIHMWGDWQERNPQSEMQRLMLNVIARQTTQIVNELVRTSVFVLTSTHVWFVFSPSLRAL